MKILKITFLLLLLIILFTFADNAQSCVKVEISGFRARTGKIYVSIYKNAESFLKIGKEVATQVIYVKDTTPAYTYLCNLPCGWYAVALYHDEDDNNKMNTFFGFPREPYGLSNNFIPRFSYPKFSQCQFYVPDKEEKDVAIALVLP